MNRSLVFAFAALALGMALLHQEAPAADGGDGEGKPAAVATVSADAEHEALPVVDGVQQEWLEVRVRVVDADGEPVAKAKVTPWALRSSQGHGLWLADDKRSGVGPQDAATDDSGVAVVRYPAIRSLKEQVKTNGVSVFVDHPDFARSGDVHVDVPLETMGSHEVKLARGVRLEVRPIVDGKPAPLDNLHAFWSDGRAWLPGAAPEKTPQGTLQLPGMAPGKNSVLIVKLEGERAVAFSRIVDFELVDGVPMTLDVPLEPSVQIQGKVDAIVPRPIREGIVQAMSLDPPPDEVGPNRVSWFTWSPVAADGTFTIDAWPAGERLQIIGLCDEFVATSGKAPDVVKNPRDPAKDPYRRPQVFSPDAGLELTLAMTPMARCVATTVDEEGAPVAGVKVVSGPNIGWWNSGSGIYCQSLVRGEKVLLLRGWNDAADTTTRAEPFTGQTDAAGKATLLIPAGEERLVVQSEAYELPVILGDRSVRVSLASGETSEATLRLQAKGTEKLGDWDKLAGVVFGCSTREGRRILALPEVSQKMDEFIDRFLEAQDKRDPQLLAAAYAIVADAFADVGDAEEATKWRRKSETEAEKAKRERDDRR
jgi:hypothetical protein